MLYWFEPFCSFDFPRPPFPGRLEIVRAGRQDVHLARAQQQARRYGPPM